MKKAIQEWELKRVTGLEECAQALLRLAREAGEQLQARADAGAKIKSTSYRLENGKVLAA